MAAAPNSATSRQWLSLKKGLVPSRFMPQTRMLEALTNMAAYRVLLGLAASSRVIHWQAAFKAAIS